MTRSVIVSAVRTPVGKYGAGLRSQSAVELGAVVIREAVARAAIRPRDVEWVVMGHVLQAGAGQITARQAAVAAGIPQEVPAITINNVCLSSLTALSLADQTIRAGELDSVIAGGMESMTNAPYVLRKVRWGARMGDGEIVDAMIHDGLWSTFTGQHMGESSDQVNAALEVSREDQDAWAARSHQRAAAAWTSGRFAAEVVPVDIQGPGGTTVVERDEGIRPDTTAEALAALPPAFAPTGTITAGNASQLSDGAAATVVRSARRAEALGLEPLAEIISYGMCADRFAYLHTVPAIALEKALKKAGRTSTTLACWRSTRPSPRSRCTPPGCWAPRRRSSTSTAARWRLGTRWAPPEPGCWSRSCTSCAAAESSMARRACAAAAAA